jgi:NhaP-type Na+/H+ or K+/H+ antiporter
MPAARVWAPRSAQLSAGGARTRREEHEVHLGEAFMLWTAGIRGPTALCLVYDFPSSLRDDFIATTLFSIIVTNVVFGGLVCAATRQRGAFPRLA